jgi:hypothetical protein
VNAVDSGDRLHQVVPFHRFVDVEGMHAGGIEAGEPHVADYDEFEGVAVIAHAIGEAFSLSFGGVVLGEVGAVAGAGGHDNFEGSLVEVVAVPVGAKLDDGGVEVGGDAARQADDHAFACEDGLAGFKVGDDVLGDRLDALLAADQGFNSGPFAFGFLGFVGVIFDEVGV